MENDLGVLFERSGSNRLKRWYNDRLSHLEEILRTAADAGRGGRKIGSNEEAMTILRNLKPRISLRMLEDAASANFDEFIYYAIQNNLVDWAQTRPAITETKTVVAETKLTPSLPLVAVPTPTAITAPAEPILPTVIRRPVQVKTATLTGRKVVEPIVKTPVPFIFSLPALEAAQLPKDLLKKLPTETNYVQASLEKETKTEQVRTAYQPKLIPLTGTETGREQKIGGHVPFFMEGETWPTDDGKPMAFYAQFVDPRPSRQKNLVRIFVSDIAENSDPTAKVLVTKLNELKPQIVIPEPANVPNVGLVEPKIITGWHVVNEISPKIWEEAAEHNKISYEDLMTNVEKAGFDSSEFKVGGYGNSQQGLEYTDAFQNVYAGKWGDAGSLHIENDGTIHGDMA
jgi:hypothetical protein